MSDISDFFKMKKYDFRNHGIFRPCGEICVARPQLLSKKNSSPYTYYVTATVKQLKNGDILYSEFGINASNSKIYKYHYLDWDSDGFKFNIVEKDPSSIITIQAFMRGSKVRCGPERWNLMFWNLKRFMDKNGRLPNKH
jgi:hypothetical protein